MYISLAMKNRPYISDFIRTIDIYLLEHPTECVYYVLREEIQIVSIHILDNRVDEIEYR